MKRILILVCFVFIIGCSAQKEQLSTQNSYTFTDDLGQQVTVSSPKRVAALIGSFADMWYLSGGEVIASADDAWDDFDLPMPENAVNIGKTKAPSLEKIFQADPDFIIASGSTRANLEMRETLYAAKIPTAYFNVSDFEDYLRVLKIFTDINNRPDLYQKNGLNIADEMEKVILHSKQRIEKSGKAPKVLLIRASSSNIYVKNSENNVAGEMLKNLGCENIADSDSSLLENLSLERIMQADPDYIFVLQFGDDRTAMENFLSQNLFSHPAWQQLSAVRENRVYYLEKQLYSLKPNEKWAQALGGIERILTDEAV